MRSSVLGRARLRCWGMLFSGLGPCGSRLVCALSASQVVIEVPPGLHRLCARFEFSLALSAWEFCVARRGWYAPFGFVADGLKIDICARPGVVGVCALFCIGVGPVALWRYIFPIPKSDSGLAPCGSWLVSALFGFPSRY